MNKNKKNKKIKESTIRLAPSLLTLKPNPCLVIFLVIFIILLKSGDTSGNWTNNLPTTPTTPHPLSHHKPPQYQRQSYPPHITFFLLAYQTGSTTTIKWNRTSPSLLAIHNTITFIEPLTKPQPHFLLYLNKKWVIVAHDLKGIALI